MSKLREAAQEALFWMQHARLHLTIKERLHPDGLIQYDNAARNLHAALAEPEVEPPRDEWRPASEPPEDGRRVLIWVAKSGGETFRPAYCPAGGWTSVFDGETLVAWRDVTPPGSDNIHNIRPLYAHPPRDEWRLASEPPEDDRSVLVWMPGKLGGLAIGRCSRGNWSPYYLGSPVTHWRDVTPPTEGAR